MSAEAAPIIEAPQPSQARKLRLWPAFLILLVMVGARLAQRLWLTQAEPNLPVFLTFVMGPVALSLVIGLWWLFFSRAPRGDRILGVVGLIVLLLVALFASHPSMHGQAFMVDVIPDTFIAFTAVLLVLSFWGPRVATIAGLIAALCAVGYWDMQRFDGMWGNFKQTMHWRWEKSAEDEFLATLKPGAAPEKGAEPLGKVTWSQFRGPNRNASVPGVVLDVDWKSRAPKRIWKHKIGPGWSSFSVAGDRLFTQEQRGEQEDVVCYDARTGDERWVHETKARFDEAMGGVGPRATPTLSGGMLYVQGATGLLQCLDPLTGAVKWERDLVKEANRKKAPIWGYASSPLIIGDEVIAYSSADEDPKATGLLLAFDAATGNPKWTAPVGNGSYSSPQLAKLGGRDLVLFWGKTGLAAIDAHSGKPAWNYDWLFEGYRVVQPLLLSETTILLGTGMGVGTRRVEVVPDKDKGDVKFEERWTSHDMKPDFNDYVAYNGYLYGLDHNILCCVDLATGTKKWKNGRYGNGQILLLPEAGQLLVLSETGDLILIHANPEKLDEVAKYKMLEGKTWNHPVLIGNRIFVRNAEEAACFELPLAGQSSGDRTKAAPKEL